MLHRDDIPYKELELIEADLKKKYPDAKIYFPGDMPDKDVPEEVKEAIRMQEAASDASVENGTCLDCDFEIEDYRPFDPEWDVPEDWVCYVDTYDKVTGWRCPGCHLAWVSEMSGDGDDDEDDEDWPSGRWVVSDELEGDFE